MTRSCRPPNHWGGFSSAFFHSACCRAAPRTRTAAHAASPPAPPPINADALAPGVVHRAIPLTAETGIDVIDLDLDRAQARWGIETRGIQMVNGRVVGTVLHPARLADPTSRVGRRQWGLLRGGGHSGAERVRRPAGAERPRSSCRAAAARGGKPDHPQGPIRPQRLRPDGRRHARLSSGPPRTRAEATIPPHLFAAPMGRRGAEWRVAQAVGCGPTLISGGKVVVTQYQERLVSPGPRPRTFVAYDHGGR